MAALVQRIRTRAASLPTFDIPFLLILLLLLSYGLIMLFSAGYAVALYRRGDAYTYIRPQLLFAALGVLAMYAASLVDYHVWHRLAWPMLGISLLLLAIVLFMPEYNGCKRWIVLPGLGTLQPSEIAKFSIVLVFSHIISLNHDRMKSFSTGVVPFALILGVVTVLMLLEPHLSGTLLILSIGAVLMFVGGTGLHWFGLAGGWARRPLRRRSLRCRSWYPTPRTGSRRGATHLPTRWAKVTRRSRASTPSRRAGWPGWGWATADRNICTCRSRRTTLFFRFCVRSLVLSGRRWSWRCFCCCSCAACRLRCARGISSAHCSSSGSSCRSRCRRF